VPAALTSASLVLVDGAVAFAVGVLLVYVRFAFLQGDWSAALSPLQLAGGMAVLWIGGLAIAGLYHQRNGSMPSLATRVLVADIALIGATALASMIFDVANISRLLLIMFYLTLPLAAVVVRLGLRWFGTRPAGMAATRQIDQGPFSFPVTVIQPPRGWPGLGLNEFWRLRRICLVLTRRNLMVRYRQTVIGAAWSLLQPILLMTVFTVFFGILARGLTDGLPFPIFYLVALVPYQMVAKILSEGSASVVSNSSLVTRVYFPRAYFPTSVALASLTDFLLALVPVAILLVYFDRIPGPHVVFAPLLVAVAWTAGLGVAYWLSALNVAYRDITQLMPFLTQLLMFLSPIIYTSNLVPENYRPLYFINPLALVVEGLRWSLADAPAPPGYAWVLAPAMAALLLVSGYVFFRRREPLFADYV
jgi:homopolymeric O-antigen transport system permease protein